MMRIYTYAAAGLLLVIALVAIWWGIFIRPAHLKQQRDEARMEATAGKGAVQAEKDTSAILQQGSGREARIDKETRDAVEAIARMPEERRDAAAIAALCLRDEYRNAPSCVELRRLYP